VTLLVEPEQAVCPLACLAPGRGVAALVDGRPIAVFLLADGSLHAVDNVDPCSAASVLSRGVVGEAEGVPTVASPMFKQRFDLRTGQCLDADVTIAVHQVRCVEGIVRVRLSAEAV
jgi:nitrite reductase (NADH) small subunit